MNTNMNNKNSNKAAVTCTSENSLRESITLTTLVKNTTAEFVCYRDGDLWYRITGNAFSAESKHEFTFEFPVPITDTGTGIFPAKVKAISLMRWVRKHFEKIQKGEWR